MKRLVLIVAFLLTGCPIGDRLHIPLKGNFFISNNHIYIRYSPGDILSDYTVFYGGKITTRLTEQAFPGTFLDETLFRQYGTYEVVYTLETPLNNKRSFHLFRVYNDPVNGLRSAERRIHGATHDAE